MYKKEIKDFTLEELKIEMKKISEPHYRAEQIFFWLYHKGAHDFNNMRNISKSLRDNLDRLYCISALELSEHLRATESGAKRSLPEGESGTKRSLPEGESGTKRSLPEGDGTEKFLFRLSDGNFIETVLIPAEKRKTICLSTQVGCKYACTFCASGQREERLLSDTC